LKLRALAFDLDGTLVDSAPDIAAALNRALADAADTSNPFIARTIPTADESIVVIRFASPRGIDMPYLLSMLHDSWMSRANTLVVPGGKMDLAIS
jgi:phosphoribulokinase